MDENIARFKHLDTAILDCPARDGCIFEKKMRHTLIIGDECTAAFDAPTRIAHDH